MTDIVNVISGLVNGAARTVVHWSPKLGSRVSQFHPAAHIDIRTRV